MLQQRYNHELKCGFKGNQMHFALSNIKLRSYTQLQIPVTLYTKTYAEWPEIRSLYPHAFTTFSFSL